jgi:hypothetical protein
LTDFEGAKENVYLNKSEKKGDNFLEKEWKLALDEVKKEYY